MIVKRYGSSKTVITNVLYQMTKFKDDSNYDGLMFASQKYDDNYIKVTEKVPPEVFDVDQYKKA